MFAKRPLLRLPLTGNHKCLCRQWCDERLTWTKERNDIVFTDESRFCLQHHDVRIRVWRHRGERLLNCSCSRYHDLEWYWISLPHPSSTHCRYTEQPVRYL
ncbi:transposable element Tcb1 transposase [Trichonephila clavipes]|nr:transposable element Tcb1 transposase [Trichonephila clavipes]